MSSGGGLVDYLKLTGPERETSTPPMPTLRGREDGGYLKKS